MPRGIRFLALVLALAALTACGGPLLRTTIDPPHAGKAYLSYHLPKRLFVLRFERSYTLSPQRRKLTSTAERAAAAGTSLAAAEEEYRLARAAADANPGDAALRAQAERLRLVLQWRQEASARVALQLAAASDAFKASQTWTSNCGFDDRFVLTPGQYTTDPGARYYAVFDHRVWRNDQLVLMTTSAGLLTSGTGTATDQSSQVAQGFARLLALPAGVDQSGVVSLRASPLVAEAAPAAALVADPCAGTAPFVHEALIDPASTSDLEEFRQALRVAKAPYRLEATRLGAFEKLAKAGSCLQPNPVGTASGAAVAMDGLRADDQKAIDQNPGGLFHRRNQPAVLRAIRLSQIEMETAQSPLPTATNVHQSMALEMPNASPCEFIAYATGALTTSVNRMVFENGMLTTLDSTRPSELVAGLTLPIEVVKAPLGLVTDLLTLRIQNSTKQKELIEAEIALRRAAILEREAREGYFGGTPPTRVIQPPSDDDD